MVEIKEKKNDIKNNHMNWINIKERLPEIGKLVYTKNDKGYISAFTRYTHGWNTKLSDTNSLDNSPIIEWLDSDYFRDLPNMLTASTEKELKKIKAIAIQRIKEAPEVQWGSITKRDIIIIQSKSKESSNQKGIRRLAIEIVEKARNICIDEDTILLLPAFDIDKK